MTDLSMDQVRTKLEPIAAWKGKFPFRLGATSYIYPGELIPNVELLSEVFDEIQLLLFEGKSYSNIPGPAETEELNRLSLSRKVSYTVHLPLDAYPGHETEAIRKESVEMIRRIYDIGVTFGCQRFVFHYANRSPEVAPVGNRRKWREQLVRSTEELLSGGIQPAHLCVENLSYPFYWVEDLVSQYSLSKCIDLGHLRVNCFPVRPHLKKHLSGSRVLHLHGVQKGRDHVAMCGKDAKSLIWLFDEMKEKNYCETVILELFQLDHLLKSFSFFTKMWKKWQTSL